MPDFLLELRSEEIPARMQAKACEDLARLFTEQLSAAGLTASLATFSTPRRLALIARGLPDATQTISEERRGPRADAPPQALEGFLKSTGLTRDSLEERTDKKGTFLYARIDKPGRDTADVLAEIIPAIVRAFPWPKSMRWGEASASTESPRWVRPITGIVALFGEHIVPCEVAGVTSGAATLGHRFHHPGIITIGSADDYETKLRACHVILRAEERARIIADGARAAARAAGLTLVEDEGLVVENAGLTEWPVPLLGRFDPAFLDVPREVIVLTMRTNQKYFALTHPPRALLGEVAAQSADGGAGSSPSTPAFGGVFELSAAPGSRRWNPGDTISLEHPPRAELGEDELAPAFVCTANIEASDGGVAIVAGNERVLSARLADAKFFWEADLKVPLEAQAEKLGDIVFHEKLGTVADKVERVAKLARWLVEEGIVKSSPSSLGEVAARSADGGAPSTPAFGGGPPPRDKLGEDLATLAERAARLCKADLVTQMVAEFPELQGTIGAHLARAQGEPDQVADAIRDHYKPVGQGDEVPTAPVTVAVSLADKLDTLIQFSSLKVLPTGSRDPFALRRASLALVELVVSNSLRVPLLNAATAAFMIWFSCRVAQLAQTKFALFTLNDFGSYMDGTMADRILDEFPQLSSYDTEPEDFEALLSRDFNCVPWLLAFAADRLKVQQRGAGVRHDLIDAVFALGGEDDLVRLLARVHALQAFVETPEGRDLLAGYKRAANILKKEGWDVSAPAEAGAQARQEELDPRLGSHQSSTLMRALRGGTSKDVLSYTPEPVEQSLIDALDSAEPLARAAIDDENFEAAMAALAGLRGPVDAFFESVIVNDPDPAKRAARLDLLARMRDAFHRVADFSRIEG